MIQLSWQKNPIHEEFDDKKLMQSIKCAGLIDQIQFIDKDKCTFLRVSHRDIYICKTKSADRFFMSIFPWNNIDWQKNLFHIYKKNTSQTF